MCALYRMVMLPWVTSNHLKHLSFYILCCLLHLCNWWSERLQIWCTGWMCKSQPKDDKPSLIGMWSGQVIWPIKNFWGSNHMSGTAEPKVIKICTRVGYMNSSNMVTYHPQKAWLWSRDCFKILPLAMMRVSQWQLGMLIPGYVESRDPNRQSRVPTGTRKGRNRRTYGE